LERFRIFCIFEKYYQKYAFKKVKYAIKALIFISKNIEEKRPVSAKLISTKEKFRTNF
jgi:DNA-binding IscR family transcriptional regulator